MSALRDTGNGGDATGPGAALDDAAFEAMFRRHYAGLCRFANGIVNAPDVAEEIVQDVFMSVWRIRDRLDVHTSVRAYLYRAVRNRSLNWRRRSRPELTLQSGLPQTGTDNAAPVDPGDGAAATERAEAVSRAVGQLPARCREVVRLRWLHGLSHEEIARTLGISRKAVEANITRGLRALRDLLSGHSDWPGRG